jgi:hypothetical protein
MLRPSMQRQAAYNKKALFDLSVGLRMNGDGNGTEVAINTNLGIVIQPGNEESRPATPLRVHRRTKTNLKSASRK